MSAPRLHRCLYPRALSVSHGYSVIPCGQCAECLKSQANQLAVRVFREAQARGPFHFVTLTYAPEHVPVWCNEYALDRETGELFPLSSGFTSDDFRRQMFNDFAPWERVRNKKGKWCRRLCPYVFDAGDKYVELFYSVNYEDIKKSFKSWRMDYQRHHDGRKVDDDYDFKMFVVPEYGGATYRPHYHLCFLGLPCTEVEHFCGRWRDRFGFAYVEQVRTSGDSSDFARVSSYLSKYACKGSFDCPYIRQGFCRRPRRGFSKDFGVGDKEDFARRLAYWRCEDVYPDLDFDHPEDYHKPINPELFAMRRHYSIGPLKYPFPSYFKRRAFFKRVPDYNFGDPSKWTLVVDSSEPESYEWIKGVPVVALSGKDEGRLVMSPTFLCPTPSVTKYHYEPTNLRLKEKGKVPTKVVATALSRMVAGALLDNAIFDLLRESGLVVRPSSVDCSYVKGYRRSFPTVFDSVSIDEASLSARFSAESPLNVCDSRLDAEKARIASVEAEFVRSIMDSLF